MSEIVKVFLSSLGWPHITLIFGILFMIFFRKPITAFIGRIRTVGKEGITAADTSTEVQYVDQRKKAVQDLMNISDSIVLKEQEELIIKDLSLRGLETEGDSIKILTRHLAATQLTLDYEQIYNLIFGSQISLLKRLNDVAGEGRTRDYMDDYFLKVKTVHQKLNTWTFDQYLDFLFKRTLITNVRDKYHITNKGVDFLAWMVRNGRTEDRGS